MAITHNFNHEDDLSQGGTWYDGYGRTICSWTWNPDNLILKMRCGAHGRTKDFSDVSASIKEESLKDRFPPIALAFAEETNNTKYDV